MRWAAALLLLAVTACAGHRCPTPRAFAGPATPFLWEVTAPSGATMWLYGTIHIGGAADVPAVVWERLATARVFVAELDEVDPEEFERLVTLPPGKGLDQLLPADSWYDLRDALHGTVREWRLRRFRPWFAMSLLTRAMVRPPSPGMDEALRDRAKSRGARIEFLESWSEQLGAIDETVTIQDLVDAIADRHQMKCTIGDMMAAYRAGELAAMGGHFDAGDEDILLRDRNLRWITKLETYLAPGATETVFVVVGVAHMDGPNGLPELLRARGYGVQRVRVLAPLTPRPAVRSRESRAACARTAR